MQHAPMRADRKQNRHLQCGACPEHGPQQVGVDDSLELGGVRVLQVSLFLLGDACIVDPDVQVPEAPLRELCQRICLLCKSPLP